MPGAHPFHAAAEAAADAARQGSVKPAEVERVVISAGVQWTSFRFSESRPGGAQRGPERFRQILVRDQKGLAELAKQIGLQPR